MVKRALLIVDMSHDFVSDDGGLTVGKPAQAIVPAIINTAHSFLNSDDVVAVCMDAHEENDRHFNLWPKHNIIGTKGQELFGELQSWYESNRDRENLVYIPKPEYDAFYQTELEDQLRKRDVKDVYVVGVCTDICNFLTVYGAYARGFKTYAIADQMATFTDKHQVFLDQMQAIFKTEVILTKDL